MIDIKLIREHPENVKRGIALKREPDHVDEVLRLDRERRELINRADQLKAKRNAVSEEIGRLKKEGRPAEDRIAEMKEVANTIKELDARIREIEQEAREALLRIPNLPHESVPEGSDPEANLEVRRWVPGEIPGLNSEAAFPHLDHVELGKRLGILDFERGAKITGSGFPVYMGRGAALERALINFMLDVHTGANGYREVFPPFLVNETSMTGTGQLPKMSEDMYKCEGEDLFLVPTAEVPLTNLYRNEMFKVEDLPVSLCGYSACFRREAGSYGKETKGFLRVHQFNKVELVKFILPEESYEALEQITRHAEGIMRALNIPYRVLLLCTGDTSFASAKTYDIEAWATGEQRWLEVSSCSNFEDFQARRANIRFKREPKAKPEFVHTLNGSGLATSRLMVALLENNQTADGAIVVPEPLRKYTGFDRIEPTGPDADNND